MKIFLQVSKTVAIHKISHQIKKGEIFQLYKEAYFKNPKKVIFEYEKWNNKNIEIILSIFKKSTEILKIYNKSGNAFLKNGKKKIDSISYKNNIKAKIDVLKVISQSIFNTKDSKSIEPGTIKNKVEKGKSIEPGTIKNKVEKGKSIEPGTIKKEAQKSIDNKIFIVHGHNNEVKETVARFLEKLKIKPIILHEQPNKGKTIIEKFEEYANVSYAIILLTPDDIGRVASERTEFMKRARQNVIFELGYFIGKLGRNRVSAIYMKDVELPSDFSGILYLSFDEKGAWRQDLVKELIATGFDLSLKDIFK